VETRTRVKATELKRLVREAWAAIVRAGQHSEYLEKALAECERVEREHRAFMGRAPYRAKYTLSVADTARYFVAKITSESHAVPKTWTDVVQIRRDFHYCGALREAILERAVDLGDGGIMRALVRSEEFKAIDYAGDIALGW
jgi:hypothetical protein